MSVHVGRRASGQPTLINLHEWHTVVSGATRSGKGIFTLAALAQATADPMIRVVGCDPSSTTLAPFLLAAGDDGWTICGTRKMHAAAEMLERCLALMDQRLLWIFENRRDKVLPVDDPANTLPTVIVVLEEFAGLVAAAQAVDMALPPKERLCPRIQLAYGRLLREAAKTRIFIWVVVQRADASTVGGDSRDQMSRRVVHRSPAAGVQMLLEESVNPEMIAKLSIAKPGVALWHEPGMLWAEFTRSAMFEYSDYHALVTAHYRGNDILAAELSDHPISVK